MKSKIQKAFATLMLCLCLGVSAFAECPVPKPGDIPIPGCLVQWELPADKPDFIDLIIKTVKDWF